MTTIENSKTRQVALLFVFRLFGLLQLHAQVFEEVDLLCSGLQHGRSFPLTRKKSGESKKGKQKDLLDSNLSRTSQEDQQQNLLTKPEEAKIP